MCDGDGASLLHFKHAARAIIAHAGEDDADSVLSGITGGGTEQYIHGRPVSADERPVFDFDEVVCAAALEEQMVVAGCNERASTQNGVIRLRLFDGDEDVVGSHRGCHEKGQAIRGPLRFERGRGRDDRRGGEDARSGKAG